MQIQNFLTFFEMHYMSVGQKLAKLKIRSTSITFLSICNLEAAPEEAMELRSSNESFYKTLSVWEN